MNLRRTDDGSIARRKLGRRRRRLLWSAVVVTLMLTVAGAGLVAILFSADRQNWNDKSQVLHTHGTVVEEARASDAGTCKGADYDTRLEWTQSNKIQTGWTRTCVSGPNVGDRVDMWVRDDGKITLTEPATTMVFIVLGILVMIGISILVFFSFRTNIRAVDKQLGALTTSAVVPDLDPGGDH